jgi:hypothetical protein
MTPAQHKMFMQNKGTFCPECYGLDMQQASVDFTPYDLTKINVRYICKDCKSELMCVYKLVDACKL